MLGTLDLDLELVRDPKTSMKPNKHRWIRSQSWLGLRVIALNLTWDKVFQLKSGAGQGKWS